MQLQWCQMVASFQLLSSQVFTEQLITNARGRAHTCELLKHSKVQWTVDSCTVHPAACPAVPDSSCLTTYIHQAQYHDVLSR